MTTKKAILVQLAMFFALLPCILIIDESGNFLYNVFGFLYAVFLVRWISCTSKGRKFLRTAVKSNEFLFGK